MQKFKTVDEYNKSFSGEVEDILKKISTMGRELIPDAEEVISYGIPTLKLNGKYVIYYAANKNHFSLYPIPEGDAEFNKKIKPHIKGKGTIQFQYKDQPIPYDLVKEVILWSLKNFKEKFKNN